MLAIVLRFLFVLLLSIAVVVVIVVGVELVVEELSLAILEKALAVRVDKFAGQRDAGELVAEFVDGGEDAGSALDRGAELLRSAL